MASILSLPSELVSLVCDHLAPNDVERLTRTCHTLHGTARPVLYRTITLDCRAMTVNDRPRIFCLLRSFVEIPGISNSTGSIVICESVPIDMDHEGDDSEQIHSGAAQLTSADRIILLEAMAHTEQEDLQKAVTLRADFIAITMLVLAQCTRVRTLSVPARFLLEGYWFQGLAQGRLNTNLATPYGPFNRLEGLTVTSGHNSTTRSGDAAGMLISCLNIPNLSTLDLSVISNKPISALPYSPLQVAEKLTALHLHQTQIPALAMKQMLQRTPRLKSLVYDYFYTSSTLDLDQLRTGLECVRLTLDDLTVRIRVAQGLSSVLSDLPLRVLRGKLGSLESFTALKKLSTSFHALFGRTPNMNASEYDLSSMLPPHLEDLLVADDLWNLFMLPSSYGLFCFEVCRQFLLQKDGVFPFMVATPELQKFSADFRQAVGPATDPGFVRQYLGKMTPRTLCSFDDNGYIDFDIVGRRRQVENLPRFALSIEDALKLTHGVTKMLRSLVNLLETA